MIDSATVSSAHNTPIERIIEQRGVKLRRVGGELVGPCPVCGGTDRFSINTRKRLFNCRGCGVGGDVIMLVQHLDSCSFQEAVAALTGEQSRSGTRSKPDPEQERRLRERIKAEAEAVARRNLATAIAIWDQARPIADTPGEEYLTKRGIVLGDVPERSGLRWHPACPWGVGTAPCIIARFTDAITAEPKGIHRRPIITGEKPKSLGPTKDCVIRLWPDENVAEGLVIGEGVETVLAAATRIEHKRTLLRPAWAAGGTSNLKTFPVLSGVECLTILVDNDENSAGQNAAKQCAQRWREAGREVTRLIPAELGLDFNDLVKP